MEEMEMKIEGREEKGWGVEGVCGGFPAPCGSQP